MSVAMHGIYKIGTLKFDAKSFADLDVGCVTDRYSSGSAHWCFAVFAVPALGR
jgi:hypothetical protein